VTHLESYEKKVKLKDIGLCHCQGAKDIKNIVPMLELANRECLIISDGDAIAIENQKSHKEAKLWGNWLRYDEIVHGIVTGEDFIDQNFFNKKANSQLEGLEKFKGNPPFVVQQDNDKLKILSGFLKSKQFDVFEIKSIINLLKESLYNGLTPKVIRQEYKEVFVAVLENYEKTSK